MLGMFIVPNILGNMHDPVTSENLRITSINNPSIDNFIALLIRNIIASFGIICMGIIGYTIFPILYTSFNALYLGEVVNMLNKPSTSLAILSLIPHCLIELPAIILCTCIACNFSQEIQNFTGNKGFIGIITHKEDAKFTVWKYAILPYIKYILPLIILACIIECTISIYILRALFNNGV